jgi:uncharacterized protein YecT (DUF1311 family)
MSVISDVQEGATPRRDQPPRWDDYGARRAVAADMEQIFRILPSVAATPEAVAIGSPEISERTRRWWVALLFFVGLLLAAILLLPHATRMTRPLDKAEQPVPVRKPSPVVSRVAPAPTAPPAILPARTKPATHPDVSRPRHPKPDAAPKRTKPEARSASRQRAAAPAPSLAQCAASGGSEAWCLRAESGAADDRLRDAYQAAVRAGVDRHMLVGINKKWVRLRKRALKDPKAMIGGYAALTEQLVHATGLVAAK